MERLAAERQLAREAVAEADAAGAALVNTGERSDPRGLKAASGLGCAAPARGVVWLHPNGAVCPVRCGASNRCWYCARLAAIETALVLRLDALYGEAPTVGMTLTTAAPYTDDGELRRAIEQVLKAIRRRWECVEYCAFVEWTTGRTKLSGGYRRVHVHVLVKGLPVEACPDAESVVRRVWKARTGAHQVEVRELRTAGGATAYLALHHRKSSQGPPAGWTGKRFRPSRGYFSRPVAELRERASQLLAEKRLLRAVAAEVEGELLAAGAAYETDELVEVEDGALELRRTLHIVAGDVYDDAVAERYAYEYARLGNALPVLMRCRHRDEVDAATGVVRRVVAEIYGPAKRAA